MKTAGEYLQSLESLNFRAYAMGERVRDPANHPLIAPSRATVAATYEQASESPELLTAESHLDGRPISRFCHLHRSADDLVAKVKMQRHLGQVTGTCFQRCVGLDALNALDSTTYEMDQELGTEYHARFTAFLRQVQQRDLTCDGAMTDPKGDRGLRPHQQAEPDVYLHIVEERADGIVVRGAKAHQTGALNAHEIIVMPTMSMGADDADFAVSFAVPSDTPGITYVLGRQPSDTRKLEPGEMDRGNARYGGHECLVIFEDVVVPWERVFLCREVQYSGPLVERFAGYHRQSYGGCKAGVGDVLIGAAASLVEIHGLQRASHLREKLVEMVHLNETLYCCGLACSTEGRTTASGTFLIDLLLANVCKLNVTRFPYEIARLAEDIAGGLMVTLPSEADLRHPEIGPHLDRLLGGVEGVRTECRLRMLRLVENLTAGPGAAAYRTESAHGAGSPQAMRVMIARQADLEHKKGLARRLAGIDD